MSTLAGSVCEKVTSSPILMCTVHPATREGFHDGTSIQKQVHDGTTELTASYYYSMALLVTGHENRICNFVQQRMPKIANAEMRDWPMPSWYAMNIHGLLLGGKGGQDNSVHCTARRSLHQERDNTLSYLKYQKRKFLAKHLPIINSDRQEGGTGKHT